MADSKLKTKTIKIAPLAFEYLCPACSDTAIKSSNMMIGVSINCKSCGKLIKLDDKKRYKKLKNKTPRTEEIKIK